MVRRTFAALVAAACAASCAWPDLRRSPRSRAGVGDGAPLPVLLVPGFGGFAEIDVVGNYFGDVPRHLRALGVDVHQVALPAFAASEVRAQHVASAIDDVVRKTGAAQVHVIAHSQGGIDARMAMTMLGAVSEVATLTTISTPHRGAPIADLARQLPDFVLVPLFAALDVTMVDDTARYAGDPDVQASLDSMSTAAMTRFDAAWPDPDGVPIFTVAGVTGRADDDACAGALWGDVDVVDAPNPMLVPSWLILRGDERVSNDGVIDTARARWGHFLGCVPADHLDEMARNFDKSGKLEPFRPRAFFAALVDRLRAYERTGDVDEVLDRAGWLRDAALGRVHVDEIQPP